MKPVVAVTQRVVLAEHDEPRDALAQDWCPVLDDLGIVPLLVPNRVRNLVEWLDQLHVAAVLLTGGGDVPRDGSAPSKVTHLERGRLATETTLLEWARAAGRPVLGVCRGMQVMNLWLGGHLVENLEQDVPGAGSHVGHPHPVRLVDAGFCDALGMDHAQVNSFHNQGVTLAGLAPGLHAFALAEQDVVEGFTHPALGWTGMQWHPERPGSTVDLDRFLLGRWMGHSGGHG